MAYTLDFDIHLGSSKVGLTLAAQLYESAGTAVGSAITTGFREVGGGGYMLTASIPDGHRGRIDIYESGVPGTVLGFTAINPQEAEYMDAAISSLPTAAQIWAYTSRTLTGFGTLVADLAAAIWAFAQRTLTAPAVNNEDTTSSEVTRYRGTTWVISVTDMGSLADRIALYATIKPLRALMTLEDAQAVVQIEETDGLLVLNKAEADHPTDGSITVDDETAGDVTIRLEARASAQVQPGDAYQIEVKAIWADNVWIPHQSKMIVLADVGRKVS